jgi:hypothetical protein
LVTSKGGLSIEIPVCHQRGPHADCLSSRKSSAMSTPRIDSYTFGRIVVDGHAYLRDLVIYPDRVAENWRRRKGHSLSPADLSEVIEARPEVLVIGRGVFGRVKVPAETLKALRAAGIEVTAEPTGRAVETYNRLRATRHVVAALHLSC